MTHIDPEKQVEQWYLAKDGQLAFEHSSAYKRLPKKLKDIVYATSADCEEDTEFIEKHQNEFSKLARAERLKLLRALFGPFASDVETSLQWVAKKENSHHGFSDAFRCKPDLERISHCQTSLLSGLLELSAFDPAVLSAGKLAVWAPRLQSYGVELDALAKVFCAIIDKGGKKGDQLCRLLMQQAAAADESGELDARVVCTFAWSTRAEGHALIASLLAEAKDADCVVFLQYCRHAIPAALSEFVRVIVDGKLTRNPRVINELNDWFAMKWKSKPSSAKQNARLRRSLTVVSECLEKPSKVKKYVSGNDPEDAYFAIWSLANHDLQQATQLSTKLLDHKKVDFRFVATYFLGRLYHQDAKIARYKAMKDADLRVAKMAFNGVADDYISHSLLWSDQQSHLKFEAILSAMENSPEKKKNMQPCVWPWTKTTIRKSDFAEALGNIEIESAKLVPFMDSIKGNSKVLILRRLIAEKNPTPEMRSAIVASLNDSHPIVREFAVKHLSKVKIDEDEAIQLEKYLAKANSEIGSSILSVILKAKNDVRFASCKRLLNSKNKSQQSFGAELLKELESSNPKKAKELFAGIKPPKPVKGKAPPGKPVKTLKDPGFGNLKWDSHFHQFNTKRKWCGHQTDVSLSCQQDQSDIQQLLKKANKYWKSEKKWNERGRDMVAEKIEQGELDHLTDGDPKTGQTAIENLKLSWIQLALEEDELQFELSYVAEHKDLSHTDFSEAVLCVRGTEDNTYPDFEAILLF